MRVATTYIKPDCGERKLKRGIWLQSSNGGKLDAVADDSNDMAPRGH